MIKSYFAQPFRIIRNESISDNFFFLEGLSLWKSDLDFRPGQYLMIDSIVEGNYLRRSYSPFKTEFNQVGLLIQGNFGGVFSSYLRSEKVGNVIRISAPTGKDKSLPVGAEKIAVLVFDSGISFALNLLSYGKTNFPFQIYWQSDIVKKAESEIIRNKFLPQESLIFSEDIFELFQILKSDLERNTVYYLAGNGQKISFFDKILRSLGITTDSIIKEIYFNHNIEPKQFWLEMIDISIGKTK